MQNGSMMRTERYGGPDVKPPDLTELHVPFCAYKKSPDARKQWRLGKPGHKLAPELCLFVPAPKVAVPRKLLKRFGVPDGI